MTIAVTPSIETSAQPLLRELLYTICPVLVASNVALELGWIHDELARVGARPTYLRSAASDTDWPAHYSHASHRLIRDGGNSPAIWSNADIRPTVLVGLTQAQPAGKIVVRADSGVYRVADLKGRRIAIYKSQRNEKIDHRRATTEHGILAALALHGLERGDVEWVDIEDADAHAEAAAETPAGIWAQRRATRIDTSTLESRALDAGKVDALYDYSIGVTSQLEATGRFKVIDDLDLYPDWTLRIANAPRTLAVSREFAEQNRDVVVAWLRAAIRAGRWINANPEAAADIFFRTTIYADRDAIAKVLRGYDLVPNLSAQNLSGLAIEKTFLHDHRYIANDFDVNAWADPSYLDEAHASLRAG
ncbi:ABC transporter substrate-binding protein [Ancylobacter sp. G4_0304]|uniref:ABC transporter substrate-binding protein n=1 Tax=Ancylobacter sp. G4_0304 TaxID=3114289 RepID=UPI0039C66278